MTLADVAPLISILKDVSSISAAGLQCTLHSKAGKRGNGNCVAMPISIWLEESCVRRTVFATRSNSLALHS